MLTLIAAGKLEESSQTLEGWVVMEALKQDVEVELHTFGQNWSLESRLAELCVVGQVWGGSCHMIIGWSVEFICYICHALAVNIKPLI